MESSYFNLSSEEFSKRGKNLLWGFSALFLLAGVYILFVSLVLGHKTISPLTSIAPLGISLIVAIIAGIATFKGTQLFFLIDADKIEYKYGMVRPAIHSFKWTDIKDLIVSNKQNKVKLIFKDGTSHVINLIWIHKSKSGQIRKQIYHVAKEKGLNVSTVNIMRQG